MVLSGKDRGKSGKVLRAFPRESRVLVEGVNVVKRHQRPTKSNQKGQIVDKTVPIHVSKVMIVDPKGGERTRVGYRMEGNKKVRFARKSGSTI